MCEGSLWREKSGLLVEDGPEELVSRAESLHKNVSLAFPDHCNSLSHCRKLGRIVDDCEFRDVDSLLLTNFPDHILVTEGSLDQSEVNSLCRC